jgi:hypothetical protein
MQKIPQIVSERLKTGAAAGGHPDANLLAAFAEHSLSERERAGVLTHLAGCGDCREIVALALPATESMENASLLIRPNWLRWPAFRWGFAAAGVALIVLGAVEFELRQPTHSEIVARQVAPTPVTAGLQDQNSSLSSSAVPAVASRPASSPNDNLAKKDVGKSSQEELPRYAPGHRVARVQTSGAAPAIKEAPANSPSPSAVSEMAEVKARNQIVLPQSADSQIAQATNATRPAESFFGYNTGPLSRAKPASIQPVQAEAAGAVSSAPRWSITAVGGLERSLDQGKTWQDIDVNSGSMAGVVGAPVKAVAKQSLPRGPAALNASGAPVFFRAVTAAGSEVWAGGTNAALFHSVDGGDHWTRVLPSSSGAVLNGDVLSVEFSDPQHGTVTTSMPEIWITSDGGQSWRKQ